VYGWSANENDIPFVTSGEIKLSPDATDLQTVRFVQEHIVWAIPKLRFEAHQYNCDFDDAVVEYAEQRDFYKHD